MEFNPIKAKLYKYKTYGNIFLWFSLLLAVLDGVSFGNEICGQAEMGMVEIVRGAEVIKKIPVTLAANLKSRQRGLMYCSLLPKGTGMFFTYPNVGRRVFWMKNTYIELAIIFIFADGRIAAIKRGEPGSLDYIQSPDGIKAVLEINYRESRNLKLDDHVILRQNSSFNEAIH
jgi:uncharacterized membrane protein (UPF0127 family)